MMGIAFSPGFIHRFWAKVDKDSPNGCWEWTGTKSEKGYGKALLGKKWLRAHRVAFVLMGGQIPSDLVLDHLCRNPGCVNPAHLEAVTTGENTRRGIAAAKAEGRQAHGTPPVPPLKLQCPQGHPYAGKNLRIRPNGKRACRQCERDRGIRRSADSAVRERRRELKALKKQKP